MLQLLLRPARHLLDETGKMIGFRSWPDLLSSAYNVKAYPPLLLKIYIGSTTILAAVSFVTDWIWNPPIAAALLVLLDLANAWYGYRVAVHLKGEGFRFSEFKRTGGKLLATIIVLGAVRWSVRAYPYASLLADVIFWWLFLGKFGKLALKMSALKVQEKGLPRLLQNVIGEFLSSKFGPLVVNAAQGRKSPPSNFFGVEPTTPQPPTDTDHA